MAGGVNVYAVRGQPCCLHDYGKIIQTLIVKFMVRVTIDMHNFMRYIIALWRENIVCGLYHATIQRPELGAGWFVGPKVAIVTY